jgi:hypothetical protein
VLCARHMALESARSKRSDRIPGRLRQSARGDSEPSELIYFKVYKSQVPVIEQAIETAALMLGSDKSRGYCLEMICYVRISLPGPRWTATTRRFCCDPSLATTNPCPVHNRRPSCLRSTENSHNEGARQKRATPTRCGELSSTASAGTRARWLAMPGVRQHATLASAPPKVPKPIRKR